MFAAGCIAATETTLLSHYYPKNQKLVDWERTKNFLSFSGINSLEKSFSDTSNDNEQKTDTLLSPKQQKLVQNVLNLYLGKNYENLNEFFDEKFVSKNEMNFKN